MHGHPLPCIYDQPKWCVHKQTHLCFMWTICWEIWLWYIFSKAENKWESTRMRDTAHCCQNQPQCRGSLQRNGHQLSTTTEGQFFSPKLMQNILKFNLTLNSWRVNCSCCSFSASHCLCSSPAETYSLSNIPNIKVMTDAEGSDIICFTE